MPTGMVLRLRENEIKKTASQKIEDTHLFSCPQGKNLPRFTTSRSRETSHSLMQCFFKDWITPAEKGRDIVSAMGLNLEIMYNLNWLSH